MLRASDHGCRRPGLAELEHGTLPQIEKPYHCCFCCAAARLVVTPPDPGIVWACTYW